MANGSFFYLSVNWQKDYIDDFKRLLHKVLIRRRKKKESTDAPFMCVCVVSCLVVICLKISNRTDFFDTTVIKWSICKWIICKILECFLSTRFTWINMHIRSQHCIHMQSIPSKNALQTHPKSAWRFFILFYNCVNFFFGATLTFHIFDLFYFWHRWWCCFTYCMQSFNYLMKRSIGNLFGIFFSGYSVNLHNLHSRGILGFCLELSASRRCLTVCMQNR